MAAKSADAARAANAKKAEDAKKAAAAKAAANKAAAAKTATSNAAAAKAAADKKSAEAKVIATKTADQARIAATKAAAAKTATDRAATAKAAADRAAIAKAAAATAAAANKKAAEKAAEAKRYAAVYAAAKKEVDYRNSFDNPITSQYDPRIAINAGYNPDMAYAMSVDGQTEAALDAQAQADVAAAPGNQAQLDADAAAALAEFNRLAAEAAAATDAAEKARLAAEATAAKEAAEAAAAAAGANVDLGAAPDAETTAAIEAANSVNPPGRAWVQGPDGLWVKPDKPADGNSYTWNDDTGWTLVPVKTELGKSPGKAWIVSPDGKSWIKPPEPQDGATYTWDDENGWTQQDPSVERPPGTPAAYVYNKATKKWEKPKQPNPTDTWDDDKGWIPAVAGETPEQIAAKAAAAAAAAAELKAKQEAEAKAAAELKAKQEAEAKAAADKAAKIDANRDAFAALTNLFASYGLESLADEISGYLMGGLTAGEALIKLKTNPNGAYAKRFAGNFTRVKNGLNALSEAEYLGNENSYAETLQAYGLGNMLSLNREDNYKKFADYISGGIAPAEFKDRVKTVVERVQNADPSIKKTLNSFYPELTDNDLITYFLNPKENINKLKEKVTASEIGAAALGAGGGLTTNVTTATELARYGVDQATAREGYSVIAGTLPTATKLGDIYNESGVKYTQTEGEAEVFKGNQTAATKRKRLESMERGSFSGSAGNASNAYGRGSSSKSSAGLI